MRARPVGLRLDVSSTDAMPWVTRLAVALPVAAAVFARWGLPHVDTMSAFHRAGVVGPTCGLTRATVALARGQVGRAWLFNPGVFIVMATVALVLVRAAIGVTTGRWLTVRLGQRMPALALAAAVLAVLWVNQQAHAGFLIHHLR